MDLEGVQRDVRLEESVEEHQSVSPNFNQAARKFGNDVKLVSFTARGIDIASRTDATKSR